MAEEKKRTRRPNARAAEIIIGAIDENAPMLTGSLSEQFVASRGARISELVEELRRSISKESDE